MASSSGSVSVASTLNGDGLPGRGFVKEVPESPVSKHVPEIKSKTMTTVQKMKADERRKVFMEAIDIMYHITRRSRRMFAIS